MKIGVIGMGFVGGTTYEVLKEYYDMIPYDKFKREFKNNFNKLSECEIIFIAVPTPMSNSGKIDLSIIKEVLDSLSYLNFKENPIVVIRSTAVPGTTDSLAKNYGFDFVYNPEFLREKHAMEDFKNMNRVVLGANNKESFKKIKKIYLSFLPNAKYVFTNYRTAEMIKYAANTALATQIIMANELYKICENLDINYDDIKNILLLDKRIAKNIDVPGPDRNLGFGGKCFPKDIVALIQISKERGYTPKLFKEVWELNLKFREDRDWEKIKGATSENKDFSKF